MGNTVEAIAYLLSGIGAQKNVGDVNNPQDTKDIPLTMDMLADKDTWMYGNGYEIKITGVLMTKKVINVIILSVQPPIGNYRKK